MVKVSHIHSVLFKFKLEGPYLCLPVCQRLERGGGNCSQDSACVPSEGKRVPEQARGEFGLYIMGNGWPKIGLCRVAVLISAEEQVFGHHL